MTRLHLAVGNPTGHEDQYAMTLTDGDGFMLRGHGSLRKARALARLLALGGQHEDVSVAFTPPKQNRGRNETTR